jgi:tetratricopeptide (TPR) repeat protein
MKTRVLLSFSSCRLGLTLLLFIAVAGCGRNEKASDSGSPKSATGVPFFKTHFQTESQFVIETICTDLLEMLLYSNNHSGSKTSIVVNAKESLPSIYRKPTFDVEIQANGNKTSTRLVIDQPIWNPKLYLPVIEAVSAKLARRPVPTATMQFDGHLLQELLSLTALNIERANTEVSSALAGNFNDPLLHEEAALVLGTFGLRECSGHFYDVRSTLCRMSAHLAFRTFLQPDKEYGPEGEIAQGILLTLMNNQSDALRYFEQLAVRHPDLAQWIRPLTAWNSSDYRPLETLKRLTVLDKLAITRARAISTSSDIALEKLSRADLEQIPDLVRILGSIPQSVAVSHLINSRAVPMEIGEAMSLIKNAHRSLSDPKQLGQALNVMPGRCISFNKDEPGVSVIGWGHTAFACQRHLLNALHHAHGALRDSLGLYDQAKQFASDAEAQFSDLYLSPLAHRLICYDEPSYHRAQDKGFAVMMATPHLVSPQAWNYLAFEVDFAPRYSPFHNHISEWHNHNPLPGTAYNLAGRFYHQSLTLRSNLMSIYDELHRMAPFDSDLNDLLWRHKMQDGASLQEQETLLSPMLDYSSWALLRVARSSSNDLARSETLLTRAAEIDPLQYWALGGLVMNVEDDKAVKYFEKARSLGVDPVTGTRYAQFLVEYYLDKKQTNKAEEVANWAGGVYSGNGLEAKAGFYELTGRSSEARKWYKTIEERYNDSYPLVAYLLRYRVATHDTQYDSELRSRQATLFPQGLESVTLASFKWAPRDGVVVNQENDLLKKASFAMGDVIVALWGTRVRNLDQYTFLRELSEQSGEMKFIVWNGKQYLERTANPPQRRFNAEFQTYVRGANGTRRK